MKLVQRNRGSITDYDEAKRWHEDALRCWKLLAQCWYWLCGEGKDDPRGAVQRVHADQDRVLAGWGLETLAEAHTWNAAHPIARFPYRKPAKSVATSSRSRSFESDIPDSEDTRAALLAWTPTPMVARDWVATYGGPEKHLEILRAQLDFAERGGEAAAARFYRQAIRDIEHGKDPVAAIVEVLDTPNPDDQPW